jgi:hypothetical protein
MAKDRYLDVAAHMTGGTSDNLEQTAQQQVREREEHGAQPPTRRKADPKNALPKATISGLCPLQAWSEPQIGAFRDLHHLEFPPLLGTLTQVHGHGGPP